MNIRKALKVAVPSLLLLSTLFPVYVRVNQHQAITLYQLLSTTPWAILAPIAFAASIYFAATVRRHFGLYSALLAILGIGLTIAVNLGTDTNAPTPEPASAIFQTLYLVVTPLAYTLLLITKLVNRQEERMTLAENAKKPRVQLYDVSLRKFYLLYMLTGGAYAAYWAYQNWKTIKYTEHTKISVFWRAYFNIFFIGPLLGNILRISKKHGYKGKYPVTVLVVIYYIALLTPNVAYVITGFGPTYARIVLGALFAGSLVYLPALKAIKSCSAESKAKHKVTWAEVVITLLGALVFAFTMFVSFTWSPNMRLILSPHALELRDRANNLHGEYKQCVSRLQDQYRALNLHDQSEIDKYSAVYEANVFSECVPILQKQNDAVHEYYRFIGEE